MANSRYSKLLYIDSETTGLFPTKHDPHQIAIIIEIEGKVVEKEVFYSRPVRPENVDKKALDICGKTKEEIMAYPHYSKTYYDIVRLFDKYVNKFDKNDKFISAGQNVRFDLNMMKSWFMNAGDDKWFYSYVDSRNTLDTLEAVKWLQYVGLFPEIENNKLSTICKVLDISLDAHDAMNDIVATREVLKKFTEMIGGI